MKHITVSLLLFLVSLMVYSWIGFLWVLYNSYFASTGTTTTNLNQTLAANIQTVVFLAVIGALITGIVAFVLERGVKLSAG
jgi:hypothetical protein